MTLRETIGAKARFSPTLRDLICQAVRSIAPEDLPAILKKHETDPGNFDSTVERNLRALAPDLIVRRNDPVSERTRFESDLVIENGASLVCVEIEKGNNSRFELDILKMQMCATKKLKTHPEAQTFGAFIVPTENKVDRFISGNTRESSFAYLSRLCKMLAEIDPFPVIDILIIGYAATKAASTEKQKRAHKPSGDNVRTSQEGLLPDSDITTALRCSIPELVSWLRNRLAEHCPQLRETRNARSRYLGYANAAGKSAFFIYIQPAKKRLKIDLNAQPAPEKARELKTRGFLIEHRDNFQAKQGWLTGWVVPFTTDKRDIVLRYCCEALR
jgi:hypothetical protein